MPPNVVLARLRPGCGEWFSELGQRTAEKLTARPFLALRVLSADYGMPGNGSTYKSLGRLFVISPCKPEGIYRGFYCAISPAETTETRVISVYPPLDSGGQRLYVHTAPFLNDFRMLDDAVPFPLQYQLDYRSFVIFCYAVHHDLCQLRQRLDGLLSRDSGGTEMVQDDWETWSAPPRGFRPRRLKDGQSLFEHLMPLDRIIIRQPPTILPEMRLIQQLESDHTWQGVELTSDWVINLRHSITSQYFDTSIPKHAYGAMHRRYNTDIQGDVRVAIDILEAEDVPYDGQPLPDFQETIVRWDDPSPDFDEAENPGHCPRIPAGVFRVIVFDLIGTLIDRDMAIVQAVLSLDSRSKPRLSRRQVLNLYIGCESSRTRDNPRAGPIDNMRLALHDVAMRLGCPKDDSAIDHALAVLRRPIIYEDARSGLDLLHSKAVELLALPLPESLFSSSPDLPPGVEVLKSAVAPPDGLYLQISEKCDIILSRAKTIYPDIRASEILLIAASTSRAIEPSRAAGFQSALIARAESLTSSIRLDTAPPTYSADSLSNLFPLLESLSEDDQFYELDPYCCPAFRIRGLWQCNEILGEGSFGTVYNAFHLFTKEEVAIKVDMPDEELRLPCALPYEAKIYRVLQGHFGILEPRWYGEEGGAGVMIMDRLGPNLDQLRRFCRGTFSMKTICMLALQMISRIEFAHTRGIVIRDIKPTNFAMGMDEYRNVLFLIDFGVAKLCMNPITRRHIPFRSGRRHIGTARYSSYNSHFGHELGRRDDIEAFGTTLLFLLHGRLPWQGIYAPNEDAKLRRIGEMKAGEAMRRLLAQSPPELTALFNHSRSLSFEDEPDYDMLRGLFLRRMRQEKWENDGLFDWIDPRLLRKGTLLPEEYLWDPEVAFDVFKHVEQPWA